MVLQPIAAFGGSIVVMGAIALLMRVVGGGRDITLGAQTMVVGTAAYYLVSIGFLQWPVAFFIALVPLFTRGLAHYLTYRTGKKVLSGEYGEASRWAGEIIQSGDETFTESMTQLTQMQVREIGIEAESKEELRELTVERAEDQNS